MYAAPVDLKEAMTLLYKDVSAKTLAKLIEKEPSKPTNDVPVDAVTRARQLGDHVGSLINQYA